MKVLVTGGAGYIGSHMVRTLRRAGHCAIVVDDLSAGRRAAIPADVPFHACDIRSRLTLTGILRDGAVDAVLHFASRIQVSESVRNPRLYYRDNLAASVELLESVLDAGVPCFILSSTAAIYGNPVRIPIDEEHPASPINPYGETKLAIERMLRDYSAAYGLRYAALRYFNAAGAEPEEGLGEAHEPESHLIPLVLEAALARADPITIFGDDYSTPDGTCVRDYIHVTDLAEAHLAALEHLARGGESGAFNLGTGKGHSVREIVLAAERVTGRKVPIKVGPRRPGDPPVLVASPLKAERILGWKASRVSLDEIIGDAWKWHAAR